ncbi:MAG: hypothetical protein ACYC96_07810 [Fimbriimonadaceae bacterium]
MNAHVSALASMPGRIRRGQTIVIALIMLAVILLLGFVFLGILSHNIKNVGIFQKRSVSQELAEAGLRYAHNQMLNGTLGADWRGLPTPPAPRLDLDPTGKITSDPDALYTRMGTGLAFSAANPTQVDLGGPDGLGFYTRINFANGRALVRVRYAPSDANVFSASPTGALPAAGRARSFVIIESVGRQGVINGNDPTTLNATPVQFTNFASAAALQAALSQLADTEKSYPTSQKQIGFVSIGIIDDALYVTNKDNTSRPAAIGYPWETGAMGVADVGGTPTQYQVEAPMQIGGEQSMFTLGSPPIPVANIPAGGSVTVNGDLELSGNVNLYENYTLGDGFNVSGQVLAADNNASLNIFRAEYEQNRPGRPAAWYGSFPAISPVGVFDGYVASQLNSRGNFNTDGGVFRDGASSVDPNAFPRGVSYKAPPSMERLDPATGAMRYLTLTRESGSYIGTGNSGRFGHGQGVYIDNLDDFQIPRDDVSRAAIGSEESLMYDWLNPNNGQPNSGWQGPFYSPFGAYVQLRADGFTITRDAPKGNIDHAFWKAPDGTQSSLSFLRFRVGMANDGQVHIVNALTPGITNINATLVKNDYDKGPVFNGVLYFEGNVRVRGVIPTDVQLTLVSGATIYVEGSIVRGVVGNDVNGATAGQLINVPSRSSLMLMARDYVTLNPTQFFGIAAGANGSGYDFPNNTPTPDGVYPIRANGVGDYFTLEHEFLLNPDAGGGTNPYNPQTWLPYDGNYTASGGAALPTVLMLSHSADTGSAAETFLSLNVNTGLPTSPFLFNLTPNNGASAILPVGYTEPGYTNPNWDFVYGLGVDSWQRFSQFETAGFQLIDNADFTFSAGALALTGQPSNLSGTYSIAEEATNDFTFRVNSIGGQPAAAYMLAQAAIVPSDIRIEASMFAEEGSFFVIPGNWFNPDSADTHIAWLTKLQENLSSGLSPAQASAATDLYRLNSFGSYPETPFYGEPIDVKITIYGAVSENVTPTLSQQAEYLRKWGWIPIQQGSPSLGRQIPASHQVGAIKGLYAPNLTIIYDPILGTGRVQGFAPNNSPLTDPYLRTDAYGRPLAPMPRLPVSPVLAYFGEQS